MTYSLLFKAAAKQEWQKLDSTIKNQFKKKLKKRLENPKVESDRLNGIKNCYKIKLRSAGYRLVYEVRESEVIIVIIVIAKREKNKVYQIAAKRV